MKTYMTLSEVERVCRLVASTDENAEEYKEKKLQAEAYGPWEHLIEWDAITIFTNGYFYVIVFHSGNVLKLYRTINVYL